MYFTYWRFIRWILNGIFEGALLFFVAKFVFEDVILRDGGYSGDIWVFSLAIYTGVIFVPFLITKYKIITGCHCKFVYTYRAFYKGLSFFHNHFESGAFLWLDGHK